MRGDYYRVAVTLRSDRQARLNAMRTSWASMCANHPEALELWGDRKEFFDKLEDAMKRLQHQEFVAAQAEASELAILAESKGFFDKCFHVTIRPRPDVTDFESFRSLVVKYTQSKAFAACCYTFEQKGLSDDTIGTGFHAHMVVRLAAGRTKTHCLQTAGKLTEMCGNAGLQFDKASRPWAIIENYWLNYESRDGHKADTQHWDSLWRSKMNLQPLYGDRDAFKPIPLPSPEGDGSSSTTLSFD